jgi:hypothetical protein
MSERYARLLAQWKEADARAKEAEARLNEAFLAFVERRGPEPTPQEREEAHELRAREREALNAAITYVKTTALGPRGTG